MRLIIRKTLWMFLILSIGNVLIGFQLSAQEQNKKISVKVDNVTLKEAIEAVRKQGNYSFLVRNITLSYNFPSKWMNKIGASKLAVFFSSENLYTFDHLPKGLDPERSVTDDLGERGFTYPYMRQYSFGINLAF